MRLLIRKVLQKFGYDIVKYNPSYVAGRVDEEELDMEFKWLKEFHFKTILDIGANEGQFADKMISLYPDAYIYAFEPIPETFELLCNNFKSIKKFKPINIALGDNAGEITFNKNEYSPSSSLLDLAKSHLDTFDNAQKTNPIIVQIDRLDNIMGSRKFDSPLLVKIDVQGFEDNVIRGGQETIKKADLILCEVSFVELYKGQLLFDDIYEMLKQMGFNYAGSIEQLRSPDSNRILQADAVFMKAK